MTASPVTRLFDRVSKVYDTQLLQTLVYRPAQDLALDRLRAHGAERILDVGCGTGIFTTRMHDVLGADVVGCDLSEGMLAQARDRSTSVEWLRGDVTRLPLDVASVDAAVCTEAFHWFDQPAALREFHRVLRPGGLAAVSALSTRQPALQSSADNRWKPQHNASPAEFRTLFEDAGFVIRDQHRIPRPPWTRLVSDLITVGAKS